MILSGRDIEWYVQQGHLVIAPVTSDQFQQNGIDLILADVDIQIPSDTREAHPQKWIYKGGFCLGVTQETIELPCDLMAFVQLRSSWARRGFVIPPTVVDAGFKGQLTLEIVSYQHQPVPLGERFAHLIFAKMTGPSEPYNGKYQHQHGITKAL
jgi:dCTP deaminase